MSLGKIAKVTQSDKSWLKLPNAVSYILSKHMVTYGNLTKLCISLEIFEKFKII